VIEGDFATGDVEDGGFDDGADGEGGTRAERRKAAKGRRRKK
jgi:preprotein translocase subunit SecA